MLTNVKMKDEDIIYSFLHICCIKLKKNMKENSPTVKLNHIYKSKHLNLIYINISLDSTFPKLFFFILLNFEFFYFLFNIVM